MDGGHAVGAVRSDDRQIGHTDLPDRKSTRLNSSHSQISYAVFCLKKKKHNEKNPPRHSITEKPSNTHPCLRCTTPSAITPTPQEKYTTSPTIRTTSRLQHLLRYT